MRKITIEDLEHEINVLSSVLEQLKRDLKDLKESLKREDAEAKNL